MLRALAIVLLVGGIGHSGSIVVLLRNDRHAQANRVLLDLWVAEVRLLAGGRYLAASSPRWTALRRACWQGSVRLQSWDSRRQCCRCYLRVPRSSFRIPPLVDLAASFLVLVCWFVGAPSRWTAVRGSALAVVTPH